MSEPNDGDLRVWWIPQMPMEPFHVPVRSKEEGRWLIGVLADYDQFQYEQRVRPDYANAGGMEQFVGGEWWEVDEDE